MAGGPGTGGAASAPPDGTLLVGEGVVGGNFVGYTPTMLSFAPFYVGESNLNDECIGTPADPRPYVGSGLVIGSPLSFVGQGEVGATDQAWVPALTLRPVQDRRFLAPNVPLSPQFPAFYPLDEGGGGSVRNLADFRKPGTVSSIANLLWVPGPRPGWRVPRFDNAYITMTVDSLIGDLGGWSAWVYAETDPGGDIEMICHATNQPDGLIVGIESGGFPFIDRFDQSNGFRDRVASPNAINYGQWTHVFWGGDTFKFYIAINGVFVSTGLNVEKGSNTGQWVGTLSGAGYIDAIGLQNNGGNGLFRAAEVTVWDARFPETREVTAQAFNPDYQYLDYPRRFVPFGPFPSLGARGIPSAEIQGKDSTTLKLLPLGAPTADAEGKDSTSLKTLPIGVRTAEAEGKDSTTLKLLPIGTPTAEAEGKDSTTLKLLPIGTPTAEVQGKDLVAFKTSPIGVPTAEAEGKDLTTLKTSPVGVPTAEVEGKDSLTLKTLPIGIPTAQAQGKDSLSFVLRPIGVPTAEAEGKDLVSFRLAPIGVPTAEVEGRDSVTFRLLPIGIKSAEAQGADTVTSQTGTPQTPANFVITLGGTNLALVLVPTDLAVTLASSDATIQVAASDLQIALAAAGFDVVLAPTGLTITLRNTP